MLKLLNISNFVLIPHLRVEFHSGLNLLTGETGSGKSIIVDAVNLLLGARRGSDVIREGAQSAIIEGLFELPEDSEKRVNEILVQIGLPQLNHSDLIIRREINASGRHRVYVNDQNVTAATLKSLQPYLLEIHGQFEQQRLLSTSSQLEMLDKFANSVALRNETEALFASFQRIHEERKQLARDLSEREQQLDLLRFQLNEIERINPQPHEDTELLRERSLLAQAEKRAQLSANAYLQLYESEPSVLSALATVRRQVEELKAIDSVIDPVRLNLEEAIVVLRDAAETLRDYSERAEYSPERLQVIDERLAELEKLKRKYNADLGSILRLSEKLSERLASLEDLSGREEKLRREYSQLTQQYFKVAMRLSDCRRKAIPVLEARMKEELQQVAMDEAVFRVEIKTQNAPSDLSQAPAEFFNAWGIDQVEFLLSANQGESPRSLARVASGGELSRLMLALRLLTPPARDFDATTVAEESFEETIIFDEIDAGVGGRAAESVGRRLKKLAIRQQVLCVTHQPQIARFADHHYHVAKSINAGRTVTEVRALNSDDRVRELARMIGGKEEAATLEAARWLLESVQQEEESDHAALSNTTAGSIEGKRKRKAAAPRAKNR